MCTRNMTYENHDPKMCDKCEERPYRWRVPYIYKDLNDKAHEDLGNGYRQYYVCDECKKRMVKHDTRFLERDWKLVRNFYDIDMDLDDESGIQALRDYDTEQGDSNAEEKESEKERS